MTRTRRIVVITGAAFTALVAFGFTAELVRSDFVRDELSANYVTLPLAALLFALLTATWIVFIRPRSEVGWLLGAGAAGSALGFWRFSTHPWCGVIGLVAFYVSILLPLEAALVQGIGIGRTARRVMTGAHLAAALLGVTIAVTAPSGALDRWFVAADQRRHVANEFLLFSSRGVALAAQAAWWVVVLARGNDRRDEPAPPVASSSPAQSPARDADRRRRHCLDRGDGCGQHGDVRSPGPGRARLRRRLRRRDPADDHARAARRRDRVGRARRAENRSS